MYQCPISQNSFLWRPLDIYCSLPPPVLQSPVQQFHVSIACPIKLHLLKLNKSPCSALRPSPDKALTSNILHTVHSAPCTLHSTPCTLHSALCTLHTTLCTVHSVQYSQCTVYSTHGVQFTVHIVYSVQYTQCTVYSTQGVQCTVHTVYRVQYTRCTVYSTHSAQCRVHSAHCTAQIRQNTVHSSPRKVM